MIRLWYNDYMENSSPHYKLHISVVIFSFLTMLISWTLLFSYLEWWNYVQSFYFAVTTTTTVWYGDLIPSNDTTRLAVAIYILFSVITFLTVNKEKQNILNDKVAESATLHILQGGHRVSVPTTSLTRKRYFLIGGQGFQTET